MARRKPQTNIPDFGCIYLPRYVDKTTGELRTQSVWWIKHKVADGGAPVRRSTGLKDQESAYNELVRAHARFVNGEIQDASPERCTWAHLFQLVEADYRERKLTSLVETEMRIRKHLMPFWADRLVVKLRKADVEQFKKRLGATVSPASVNRCLSILRRALQLGADHDPQYVTRAIPRWFTKLPEDNVRTGTITPEMYRAVLPEMAPHVRTAFVIGYHLGMRRGELLSLQWDQVDLAARKIRLERQQTKARKARSAPIYGDMAAILEMAKAGADPDCPFVVQMAGQRLYDIRGSWAGAFDRAGISPRPRLHDLRRTAATNMIRAGVPVPMILQCVGWKTEAMLRRYGILDDQDAAQVGRTMEQWMDQQKSALPALQVVKQ